MSKFVDQRVVEMSFDNKRFESNVKTSMGTIDKLKDSLDFSGTANSINRELNGVNVNGLSSAIMTAKMGFSALEIVGITALANITNKIVDAGIALVKSLSVDNIATGWQKFQEASISEFTLLGQGYDKLMVTDAIEKLLWFTDETSYSFTDMMSNMSKFTAAGVELEGAQKAMMGIANWAALSGQNAETASRAMYQLSQAMGSGVVRLQDWKSIETANMATKEFKDMILETAVGMNTLTRNIDGTYNTLTGKTFKSEQFRNYLQEGFLTTEVLTKTLEAYSSVAVEVQQMMEDDKSIRTSTQGMKIYEQQLNDLEASYGDLITEEQKAEIQYKRFGLKAFRAAQEARTFTDAIKATKDAVSTGWTRIFTRLFGQVEEAKKLWTDLAYGLYDVFMNGLWKKIDILDIWADNGGRNDLFDNTEESTGAFWNLFNAIIAVKDLIGGAWKKVFGFSDLEDYDGQVQDIATKLKTLTENLKEWTSKLFLSEEATIKITNILTGLLSIFKIIGKTVIAVVKGFSPLLDAFRSINNSLGGKFNLGKIFSDAGKAITIFAKSTEFFDRITASIRTFIITIMDFIRSLHLIEAVTALVDAFQESLKEVIGETDASATAVSGFKKIINAISSAFVWLGGVIKNNLLPVFIGIGKVFGWLVGQSIKLVQKIGELVIRFREWITTNERLQNGLYSLKNILKTIGSFFKTVTGSVLDFFNSFKKANTKPVDDFTEEVETKFEPLKTFIKGLGNLFEGLWYVIKALVSVIGPLFTFIGNALTAIGDKLKAIFTTANGDINFAKMFTVGFWTLIAIGIYRFADMLRSITQVFRDAMDSMFSYMNSKAMQQYMEAIKTMAISLLLMVGALLILGSMDPAVLTKSMIAMGVLVSFIVGTLVLLKTLIIGTSTMSKKGGILKGTKDLITTTANLGGLAAAFLGLGLAILLLATSLKMINNMDPDKMMKSLLIIGIMMGMMVSVMKLVGQQEKGVNKAIKSMVKVAISIALLARPLKVIGSIDTETGVRGLIGIAGLMTVMVLYSRFSKPLEGTQKPIQHMLATAVAITLLIIPLKVIGAMKWATLGKSFAAIVGIFTILILMSKIMKNKDVNRLEVISRELIKVGIALAIFGYSMLVISLSSWNTVWKSIILLNGIFGAIVGLSAYLTSARVKNLSKLIWMMGPLAVSLGAFGVAMLLIGNIAWWKILLSLGTIAAIFTMVAILGKVMTKAFVKPVDMILLGVGFTALAAGLLGFGMAMLIIGSIPLKTLIKGLGAIVVALLVLGTTVWLLDKLGVTYILLAISASFLMFSLAVWLIVAALTALAAMTAVSVAAFSAGLIAMSGAVIIAAPMVLKAISVLVFGILNLIKDAIPLVVDIFVTLVLAIIAGIEAIVPELVLAVFRIILAIIVGVSDALNKYGPQLRVALSDFLKSIWKFILGWFSDKWQDIKTVGATLIKSIVDGAKNKWSELSTWFKSLPGKIGAFISNAWQDLKDIGGNIVDGLFEGITDAWEWLKDSVEELANKLPDWIKKILGIQSPSKVFAEIGKFIDLGFAKGVDDNADVLYDSATDLGNGAVDGLEKSGLSKALTDLNNSLEYEFDNQIVITPVLDLSEIQNGKNQLYSMMKDIEAYDVKGSNSIANTTRDEFNKSSKVSGSSKDTSTKENVASDVINNTFYITGSNPKQIAEEVSKALQIQVDRRKKTWAL